MERDRACGGDGRGGERGRRGMYEKGRERKH